MAGVTRADSGLNDCSRQPEAHLCFPLAGCASCRSEWTDSPRPSPPLLTRKRCKLAIRRDHRQTLQFGLGGQHPIKRIPVGLAVAIGSSRTSGWFSGPRCCRRPGGRWGASDGLSPGAQSPPPWHGPPRATVLLCEDLTLRSHMATNLALDQDLLDHAFRVSGEPTKKAAVTEPAGRHLRLIAGLEFS